MVTGLARRVRYRWLLLAAIIVVVLYTSLQSSDDLRNRYASFDRLTHSSSEAAKGKASTPVDEQPAASSRVPQRPTEHKSPAEHGRLTEPATSRPRPQRPQSGDEITELEQRPHSDEQEDRQASGLPDDEQKAIRIKDHVKFPLGREERFPVKKVLPLPRDTSKAIPRIQAGKNPQKSESKTERTERLRRRDVVRDTMKRDWLSYAKFAWMHDEIKPVSNGTKDPFGGWGATLVDALDTLIIMNLMDEYEEALAAVKGIDFTYTDKKEIPLFETTIRYVGGLLGAYDMAAERGRDDKILVDQAGKLGQVLYGAFDTPSRLPMTHYDYRLQMTAQNTLYGPRNAVMAEVGSLSVEFTRLAQIIGGEQGDRLWDAIQRVTDALEESIPAMTIEGLWPTFIDVSGCAPNTGPGQTKACEPQGIKPVPWDNTEVYSLGAMADSTFEYFTKMYLLLGGAKAATQYRRLYEKSIDAARKWLLFRPLVPDENEAMLLSGHIDASIGQPAVFYPVMEHLTCFVGGMFGMGGKVFELDGDVEIGKELSQGCVWAYGNTQTGIAPEIFAMRECINGTHCSWEEDVIAPYRKEKAQLDLDRRDESVAARLTKDAARGVHPAGTRVSTRRPALHEPKPIERVIDAAYQLRPEAIESVWYMYRITGDSSWQDKGWKMWQAVDAATRAVSGHSAIDGVDEESAGVRLRDSCESFWFAETLKYFYLLFDDFDSVSLDRFVLNTEAHPMRRADAELRS
ncbi:hypothetical protein PYCC9005_006069 [Savitreella phatthalungensis]